MSKTKKIAISVVSLALVAVIGIGATLAYLIHQTSVNNEFTIGNTDIDITEPNFPKNPIISSGEVTFKDPFVTNNSENDAYVRIKVTIPTGIINNVENQPLFVYGMMKEVDGIHRATAEDVAKHNAEVDQYLKDNPNTDENTKNPKAIYITEGVYVNENASPLLDENGKAVLAADIGAFLPGEYNTADWTLADNGGAAKDGAVVYTFYYNDKLSGKQATSNVFDGVMLNKDYKESAAGEKQTIVITGEAIQTEGFDSSVTNAQQAFAVAEQEAGLSSK